MSTDMTNILSCFSSHYSLGDSILTLEEAGKTKPGNPVSICDLAVKHNLKQVVIVDRKIDGFLEAYRNLSKPYKPSPPKVRAEYDKEFETWTPDDGLDLAIDEIESIRETKASGAHQDDEKRYADQMARYEKAARGEWPQAQFIFGLKICVCADMNDKSDESLKTESNVIIFIKNTQGYSDLIRISNRAWTDGFYYQGRADWTLLKKYWTPNLSLALPFFSSFIAKNQMTFSNIVPDFPVPPTLFKEMESGLPFAPILDHAVDKFAREQGLGVQDVKSIYYASGSDYDAYTTFRAIHNRSEFARPNVDHMCSDRFSFKAWQELTGGAA